MEESSVSVPHSVFHDRGLESSYDEPQDIRMPIRKGSGSDLIDVVQYNLLSKHARGIILDRIKTSAEFVIKNGSIHCVGSESHQ